MERIIRLQCIGLVGRRRQIFNRHQTRTAELRRQLVKHLQERQSVLQPGILFLKFITHLACFARLVLSCAFRYYINRYIHVVLMSKSVQKQQFLKQVVHESIRIMYYLNYSESNTSPSTRSCYTIHIIMGTCDK